MSNFSDLMGRIIGGHSGVFESTSDQPASFDVAELLNAKARSQEEAYDWKRSIVDLMKLVDLDASYGSRKELALELGYKQIDIDRKGSAEMNIWLHRKVMQQLADNGGKLPSGILD